MMASMKNKVAVVTGAGGGIGSEIAREFARRKANLVLVDIDEQNLENTAQICKNVENTEVLIIKADLTAKEDLDSIVQNTLDHFKNIDFLVNNAGIAITCCAAETSWDNYNKVMDVNLRAPFFLIKEFLPSLKKTKGSVVNVGSVAAVVPSSMISAYSVSKGAVNCLTRTIAQEVAEYGVKVNGVNPGATDTIMIGTADNPSTIRLTAKACQPLCGVIEPQEIAKWIVFLASDESGPITGQNITIDGGKNVMDLPLDIATLQSAK